MSGIYYQGTNAIPALFVCTVFRTSFNNSNRSKNRAFLDFDRSDFFNFYIHGDGRISFSIHGGSIIDNYGIGYYNDDKPHIACASYDSNKVNDTTVIVDGNVEVDRDNFAL
ncbi:MAG: hypothetical protein GXP45_01200 [bacterium]|nr:hypothetical protein [bacterium]